MFFSISLCAIVERESGPTPWLYGAAALDGVLGVALLIIGATATHLGFLPTNVQYAFIGAGAAYTFGILCGIGAILKILNKRFVVHEG